MAIVWLILATVILVGTYVSLPLIANSTLVTAKNVEPKSSAVTSGTSQATLDSRMPHSELYTLGILTLALLAICFACFLLGRTAFVEIELAARFAGLADALCIAGDNFDQLEKTAALLMPETKYLSVPEIFSIKDVGSALELLNKVKK
jgi:hypothetical protein